MTYVSGFVTPVGESRKAEYLQSAKDAWPLFKEYGALSMMENWGDHVPEGKQTDLRRAVDLKDGETVVYSFIVWPDRETSKACEDSYESDERWHSLAMPFDGKRMIYGGFETIFSAEA